MLTLKHYETTFDATFINWGFSNGTKSVVWATLVWEISIPMRNKTNKLHYLEIHIFCWNFTLMVHVCDFNYIISGKGKWGFFTFILPLPQLWNLRYIYVTIWNWTFKICNHNFYVNFFFKNKMKFHISLCNNRCLLMIAHTTHFNLHAHHDFREKNKIYHNISWTKQIILCIKHSSFC